MNGDHRRWVVGCWVFFVLWYLLWAAGHFTPPDGEVLFRLTRKLATRGTTDIAPITSGFATQVGQDGRHYPQYGLGQPLLAIPWYLAGELWSRYGSAPATWFGVSKYHHHGRTAAEFRARCGVTLFNAFVSATLVTLAGWCAIRLWGTVAAGTWTAVGLGLGTIVWPYSRTFFTEPLAALCLLAAWALLAIARPTTWTVLGSGILAGYAVLVRVDSVLWLPGLALLVVVVHGRQVGRWLLWALPIVAVGLLLLWLNYSRHGHPLSTGYEDQPEGVALRWPVTGVYGLLLSPGRSIFLYCPVVIMGLYGWRLLWRQRPMIGWATAAAAVPFALVMAAWPNWDGCWSWGPRHLYQCVPFLALGLGWLGTEGCGRAACWVGLGLLAAGVVVSGLGAAVDFIEVIDRAVELAPESVPAQLERSLDPVQPEALRAQLRWYNTFSARHAMLYDPEFFPPLLHARWLGQGGADLLAVRLLLHGSYGVQVGVLLWLVATVLAAGWWLLLRDAR